MIDITSDEQLLMLYNHKNIVIDWYATWCGPCQMIAPQYEQLALKYTDYVFAKVDVAKCQNSAEAHGVMAMPTFQIIRDGKIHKTIVGNIKELESYLKS